MHEDDANTGLSINCELSYRWRSRLLRVNPATILAMRLNHGDELKVIKRRERIVVFLLRTFFFLFFSRRYDYHCPISSRIVQRQKTRVQQKWRWKLLFRVSYANRIINFFRIELPRSAVIRIEMDKFENVQKLEAHTRREVTWTGGKRESRARAKLRGCRCNRQWHH